MSKDLGIGVSGRGILTLAYGERRFIEQARSLAHSLELHAPGLPRAIVTDSEDPGLRELFTVIPYRPEFGSGVRQKLYLDLYSPFEETLFIDSDCLVLGDLSSFWQAFAGQAFGVPGFRYLERGSTDPYLDVNHVLDTLQLTRLPKFNGGVYYFNRSAASATFFETARKLLDDWNSLNFQEFRGNGPADEALYSVAMAMRDIAPVFMNPGGMWTPVGYTGRFRLDAIKGSCSFMKEGMLLTPEVIHFPGEYGYLFAYTRERSRLQARIEGKAIPMPQRVASFVRSALWQLSRRSSGLARMGRSWVRWSRGRAKRSKPTGAAVPPALTDSR